MKKIVQYMQKINWNYKYSIGLSLVAFIICFMGIFCDPEYLFRETPGAGFSFFSKAFIRGCVYSFAMWVYVDVLLHAIAVFLRFASCKVNRNISSIKTEKITTRKLAVAVAGAFVVIVLAIVFELLWRFFSINGMEEAFNPYVFLFFVCVFFSVYVIVLYFYRMIDTFEQLFLILALTVGFCYSFGLPPTMISWDESIHYQRTIDASHLTRAGYTQAELDIMLMEIPPAYDISYINNVEEKLNNEGNMGLELDYSYRDYFDKYLSYIPAGTVMGLCKLLNLGFTFTFCIGRYTNFILYAVIVYFAMKRLKSGKIILGVIAAFPLNIFLASVYSYDFYMTALCMLGFSYLVGELQRPQEKITLKNTVIIIASFFLGIGTKAIYFPVLLLCLLLPESKFSSKKVYHIFRLAVCVATVITILSFMLPFLMKTPGGVGDGDVRGGNNVSVSGQIQYILQYPFVYAKLLLEFLFGEYLNVKYAAGYTCHFGFLGFVDYAIPVMMLLAVACFADRDFVDITVLTVKFRIVTIGISFATIVLVATSMYLAFTDVGLDTINGCQSRYLEPLLFPIVYCIGTGKIHFTGNERIKNIMFSLGSISILYAAIWEMCILKYR